MKKGSIVLVLFLIGNIAFSQDLQFAVKGKYTRGVSKEKLHMANMLSDIRSGYPSSWVNDYTSTEITVTSKGKVIKAYGLNETLSAEQQSLLQTADMGSDIIVDIGYIYLNPVTQFPDIRKIHFVETVVPDVEAQFPGGHDQLTIYVAQNAIDKIPDNLTKEIPRAIISFTVSETGEVMNAKISNSSKHPEIDNLLLQAIMRMPMWKPAENAMGVRISQEFEFIVGKEGC